MKKRLKTYSRTLFAIA